MRRLDAACAEKRLGRVSFYSRSHQNFYCVGTNRSYDEGRGQATAPFAPRIARGAGTHLLSVSRRRDPELNNFGPAAKVRRQRFCVSPVSALDRHAVLELLAALA